VAVPFLVSATSQKAPIGWEVVQLVGLQTLELLHGLTIAHVSSVFYNLTCPSVPVRTAVLHPVGSSSGQVD
jgi:hypothetical protein